MCFDLTSHNGNELFGVGILKRKTAQSLDLRPTHAQGAENVAEEDGEGEEEGNDRNDS